MIKSFSAGTMHACAGTAHSTHNNSGYNSSDITQCSLHALSSLSVLCCIILCQCNMWLVVWSVCIIYWWLVRIIYCKCMHGLVWSVLYTGGLIWSVLYTGGLVWSVLYTANARSGLVWSVFYTHPYMLI